MITARFNIPPGAMGERIRARGPEIIAALQRKLTEQILELASRIVLESIPTFFKGKAQDLRRSVTGGGYKVADPTVLDGTELIGSVSAGGPETTKITKKSGAIVDYARVQEYGAAGPWTIKPFEKRALQFMVDGKLLTVRRVTHPGLQARPFMRSTLRNMAPEIVAQLQSCFTSAPR